MNRFLPAIVVMFSFELAGWSSILAGTTTVSNIHNWRERVISCQDFVVTQTIIKLQVSSGVKIVW